MITTPQDPTSVIAAIKRCTSVQHLKAVQAHLLRSGRLQDTCAGALIESTAVKLRGHLPYAHSIFSSIHNPNLFTWNTLIRGYSLSDSPLKSISLYKEMLRSDVSPNSFTFGFLLKACGRLTRLDEAETLHPQILRRGLDFETVVLNGLMKSYADHHRVDSAQNLFDEMPRRDVASWSLMISGYSKNGRPLDALDLFMEMHGQNVGTDEFTLASVVGVCAQLGALDLGKWVHAYIEKEHIKIDVVLCTNLIEMYSKCGSLENALGVFNRMPYRDVMAWSAMIGGYAIHGHGKKALNLFYEMKRANVSPNDVTFTCVLTACSHSGLIDEGCRCFDSMQFEYGIKARIEHYGCMVDLFCRAGLMGRAHDFIVAMPLQPNAVLWRTLLTACTRHGKLGELTGLKLLKSEALGGEDYVLVSNVYASLEKWSSVSRVRDLMKENNVRKERGWSSIEVDFVVHRFVMGDESHPRTEEIYWVIDEMWRKLKQDGIVEITTDVLLHDID